MPPSIRPRPFAAVTTDRSSYPHTHLPQCIIRTVTARSLIDEVDLDGRRARSPSPEGAGWAARGEMAWAVGLSEMHAQMQFGTPSTPPGRVIRSP